jgi:hypothetical protein
MLSVEADNDLGVDPSTPLFQSFDTDASPLASHSLTRTVRRAHSQMTSALAPVAMWSRMCDRQDTWCSQFDNPATERYGNGFRAVGGT